MDDNLLRANGFENIGGFDNFITRTIRHQLKFVGFQGSFVRYNAVHENPDSAESRIERTESHDNDDAFQRPDGES